MPFDMAGANDQRDIVEVDDLFRSSLAELSQ